MFDFDRVRPYHERGKNLFQTYIQRDNTIFVDNEKNYERIERS
ncbi:hypothetical protein [Methanohalobium evestigatum]|nr:hypothetical protein [Methanohalobium evestigatum]